jgi:hypothetical protein
MAASAPQKNSASCDAGGVQTRFLFSDISYQSASVNFTINNPQPGVSSRGNQWCLPAAMLAVVAGLSVMLLLRKKKGEREKIN